MAILVVVQPIDRRLNKNAFELVTFGKFTAQKLNTSCICLVIGSAEDAEQLGIYGADQILNITHPNLEQFDSQVYTQVIVQIAEKYDTDTIILRDNSMGRALEGRLAVKLGAGSVSAVNSIPIIADGFVVTKSVYSGKAIAKYMIKTPKRVLTVAGNTLQPQQIGTALTVETLDIDVQAPRIKVLEKKTVSGRVPLPEAELVVSAGRGMKGPENWGIIEELAEVLGATTACSRPVADTGWRPHHEHVGQTGVAIRPNLYIAAGISGAIQHLAGVNNSKVIVVINKDPEAPFFKAADYGVVGDLFEVVPKLTQAIKKFKNL